MFKELPSPTSGRALNFVLHPWQLFSMILAGWVNQQQQRVIDYLRTENQVLREKLAGQLRARGGRAQALDEFFARHHEGLRRMIEARLGRRLQGCADISGTIRDAHPEVAQCLEEYLVGPKPSLFPMFPVD